MESVFSQRVLNIPNCLTALRMALLPVIAWRYRQGDTRGALLVYLCAMLTDAIDGYIARRFHQQTELGKLLDPLADKLSLLMLLWLFGSDGQIPLWVARLILLKEAALVLGSLLALKWGIVVSALPIGKATTALFIASMAARFAGMARNADVLLGMSVLLSFASLFWYGAVLLRRVSNQIQIQQDIF